MINKNKIENHKVLKFERLIEVFPELAKIAPENRAKKVCEILEKTPQKKGFLFNNYCLGGTEKKEFARQYFSDENGQKGDAIRAQIQKWYDEKRITGGEFYFLLATLLENIDKVANTASVYGAFLKHLKKSAQKVFEMRPAEFFLNDQDHEVLNENIEDAIEKVEGDILYLDPPYNQRQYAPNYHILETIARGDAPKISGKTGLRNYENQKSDFCQKKKVLAAFENIIQKAKVKYIFLSYNNEGLMRPEEIEKVMSTRDEYGFFTQKYSRFRADTAKNRNHTANSVVEYLHFVKCR